MELLHEIAGVKYLLIQEVLTADKKDSVENRIQKYKCIIQNCSVKQVGWFLPTSYATLSILVPEYNALAYTNDIS